MATHDVRDVIAQLRAEHDALVSLVRKLDEADLSKPSYASDWTVAQVLSHLGSGGEINASNVRAAVHGTERLPKEAYPELWARWDGSNRRAQADGFQDWHGRLVASLEEIPPERLDDLEIVTAMGAMTPGDVAGMRLREAALHSWDIAVAFDPSAKIRTDSVPILVDQLAGMMGRAADAEAARALEHDEVGITTTEPDRSFVLSLSAEVDLTSGDGAHAGTAIELPSEGLVRLVYGRFDAAHAGPVTGERPPGLLDSLRTVFTGY